MSSKKKGSKKPTSKKKKDESNEPTSKDTPVVLEEVPEGSPFYGVGIKSSVRRDRFKRHFNELADVILASDPSRRGPLKNSSLANDAADNADYFPTLQVGYISRAVGLNISQNDLVYLVQLIEYDAPASGCVSRSRLEAVLIDTLMTNVLGSDTLRASGIIPLERFGEPISLLRSSETEIYNAFKAIDKEGKGYLLPDELRAAMTSEGERMTDDEVEEMLQALLDPETGHLMYEEAAGVLSTE